MGIVVFFIACGEREEAQQATLTVDKGATCLEEIIQSTASLENLPVTIEQDIVAYLNREFGAPTYSEPLKLNDLYYVGQSQACGKPAKYWKYCQDSTDCCAVVQPFNNTYIIGTAICALQ